MTTVSVTLIIIGIICVVLSIVFNFDKDNKESQGLSSELTKEQQDKLRKQINEIIDSEILNVTEKTESSLDKISNTKILEMNEYAENVLGEINRNHNETVFLYDMLNEKAKEIKSTVKDVNITKRQVEKIHAEVTENVNKDEEAISEIEASDSADVKDLARQRLEELVKKSDSNRDKTLTMRKTQAEELERKKVASEVDKEVFKVVDFAKEKENIILSEENQKKDFIKAEDANPFSDVITDIEEIKESAKKATSKEAKEDAELDAEADVLEGFEFEEPVGFEEVKAEATSEAAATETATETKATSAETSSAKTKTSKLSEAADTTEVPEVAADEVKKVSKSRKKSETTVKKSTTRKTSTKKTSDQRKLDLLKQNISDVEFDSDASNNDRILKLSSLGFSNKDIAKYLNLGIGEVKLVVDLYKETK
ncbi:DUF6115 domain-containing protein [Lachnospira pectinoschiza]|uniref:Uncharacterized protein n=1 Tax=Lachnospira pectinoschiza TaxID=28052 RepID=A0A1G9ZA60_9FIRM|nr:DUF6115 domain-containing protein [Lachnospira pectinoschiza]SDN18342.1 hypothetical protein SAMN05216544_2103 [Lachnospira pectinoschiza]